MKFTSTVATLCIAAVLAITNPVMAIHSENAGIVNPQEALEAVGSDLPPDVTLTGTTEPIEIPPKNEADTDHDKKEWFGGGLGGLGTWGNWGGWGGFGPYRFGYSCRGFSGWAYPLGYWNAYGSGIYGGSCGLGLGWGGLYYC